MVHSYVLLHFFVYFQFLSSLFFFFFNDTATTEIYTLSLHDALPIFVEPCTRAAGHRERSATEAPASERSEEHTSELQSQSNLVCRLLLEKKKNKPTKSLKPAKYTLTSHFNSAVL